MVNMFDKMVASKDRQELLDIGFKEVTDGGMLRYIVEGTGHLKDYIRHNISLDITRRGVMGIRIKDSHLVIGRFENVSQVEKKIQALKILVK